jgi:hypothetical protein
MAQLLGGNNKSFESDCFSDLTGHEEHQEMEHEARDRSPASWLSKPVHCKLGSGNVHVLHETAKLGVRDGDLVCGGGAVGQEVAVMGPEQSGVLVTALALKFVYAFWIASKIIQSLWRVMKASEIKKHCKHCLNSRYVSE